MPERMAAIVPCSDLDTAEAFFGRLGFHRDDGGLDGYRMLSDGLGAHVHLQPTVPGWLLPGQNPFGLYLYRENVDGLATAFAGEALEPAGASHKPWGMYEFALNGPDDILIRVGWPSKLISASR